MPTPHKHAALIKAWVEGAAIEVRVDSSSPWYSANSVFPGWYDQYQYRVKPEPKPDLVVLKYVSQVGVVYPTMSDDANLKLVFDGETGELKDAQVLAKE